MTSFPDGVIELVPNQPLFLDLVRLTDNIVKIDNKDFTAVISETLHRINRPPMIFKGEKSWPLKIKNQNWKYITYFEPNQNDRIKKKENRDWDQIIW